MTNENISLRDWFAGMALIGLAGSWQRDHSVRAAEDAYVFADAMLKERDKKREAILDEMVAQNQEMGLYEDEKL